MYCVSYRTIACIGRKLQYKRDVWHCVIATSRTIWRKRHWWLPGNVQIVQQMEIRVTLFSRIYIDCAICIALYFVVVRTDWRRKTNYQWMYCLSIVYIYTKISLCSMQRIYGSNLCNNFICTTFFINCCLQIIHTRNKRKQYFFTTFRQTYNFFYNSYFFLDVSVNEKSILFWVKILLLRCNAVVEHVM